MECRFCGGDPYPPCPSTGAPVARTPAPVATPALVATSAPEKCATVFGDLAYNPLRQSFPGNPDTDATAFVFCSFCDSGRMLCNASGFGPPVVNFCGDDSPGFAPPAP